MEFETGAGETGTKETGVEGGGTMEEKERLVLGVILEVLTWYPWKKLRMSLTPAL